MTTLETALPLVSSLRIAAENTRTALWSDSAEVDELRCSMSFGSVGATTDPVVILSAIQKDIDRWRPRIAELSERSPSATERELSSLLVEELVVDAARTLLPLFHKSGGRDGRVSVHADLRLHRSPDAMTAEAVRLSALAENITVSIPATSSGLNSIEEATFRGVSVNATASFTVSQALAAADAIERGLRRRGDESLPTAGLGSVVSIMGGSLDDWLKNWTQHHRILIDPGHLEWAGIAVIKRAYGLYAERGYRPRLLSAALSNHLQWSELIGADMVVSVPLDWQLRIIENGLPVWERIEEPVAREITDELIRLLPEFRRAYEVNGMSDAEFDGFGATRATLRRFLDAETQLDALVRDVLIPAP